MAIDCNDVPPYLTYDCTNPWGQDCTSSQHFHFASLWNYTQNIQEACANDTRLFIPTGGISSPRNASLTLVACAAIAGLAWTYYPGADIWTRLTTWKFPLLQLVASFPRPPLSLRVDCFVIVHLLGDPIDTIKSLLAKMSSCQRTAEYWRTECKNVFEKRVEDDEDRDWEALALLTDAYGEWGEDEQAKLTLQEGLSKNPQHREVLASAIGQTGRALAADRSTRVFPIIVALFFFIGAVGIAIFRTGSAAGVTASSNTVFINVEAHSIAFSALYFWIIPAVFLGSVIGVSQTEAAIPRILRRFQVDVDHLNLPNKVKLPNHCLDDKAKRVFHGGIYSWHPLERTQPDTYLTYQNVLPILVVIIGAVTSMTVSALVPPDGWDCRHRGEIFIFIIWILSASVDILLNYFSSWSKKNQTKVFWITCIKDFLVTIATMSCVVIVQIGVYNRCSCYTQWGRTGLTLPEMPDVAETLFHRLTTAYPAITFASIGIELIIIPLLICIQYEDALRTFVQRDDGNSNAAWLVEAVNICQASIAKFRATNLGTYFRIWKAKRTGTSAVERGAPGEPYEMRSLTQIQSGETESMAIEDTGAEGPFVADGHLEPIAPQDPTSN